MYYIYQHRTADTNEIFYVGKGKDKRFCDKNKRGRYWKFYVEKHGFVPEVIKADMDEELAFLAEMECIDAYKKRGVQLINLTDGGEGCSGYSMKHTEEQKAKWSRERKGTPSPRKGVILSEETRSKISQSRIGIVVQKRRALSDEQVREIRVLLPQHSIAALARKYGVGESTIRRLRDGERYAEVK